MTACINRAANNRADPARVSPAFFGFIFSPSHFPASSNSLRCPSGGLPPPPRIDLLFLDTSQRVHCDFAHQPHNLRPCQLRVFAVSRFGCFDFASSFIHCAFPRSSFSSSRPSSSSSRSPVCLVFSNFRLSRVSISLIHRPLLSTTARTRLHHGWCRTGSATRNGGRNHEGCISAAVSKWFASEIGRAHV